jgi:hypothetical protein
MKSAMILLNNDKYIYKYVPFNLNTLKGIIKGELWFGSFDDFNDPFDGNFIIGNTGNNIENRNAFLKNELRGIVKDNIFNGSESNEKLINYYLKDIVVRKVKNYYGISCFTTHPDNKLMWSHYAEGHTGLCLIFDKEKLLNSLFYGGNPHKKVNIIEFKDENYSESLYQLDVDFPNEFTIKAKFDEILRHKDTGWSYENEVRFYFEFSKNPLNKSIQYHKESLRGIIFGLKTNKDNIHTLDALIKETSHYKHLTPFHVRYSESNGSIILPGVPYSPVFKRDFYPLEDEEITENQKPWKPVGNYEIFAQNECLKLR